MRFDQNKKYVKVNQMKRYELCVNNKTKQPYLHYLISIPCSILTLGEQGVEIPLHTFLCIIHTYLNYVKPFSRNIYVHTHTHTYTKTQTHTHTNKHTENNITSNHVTQQTLAGHSTPGHLVTAPCHDITTS